MAMSELELSVAERSALEQQLRGTHDARIYRRTLALLLIADGQKVEDVAQTLQVDTRSVWRWLAIYRQQRIPEALAEQPGRGRPRILGQADLDCLEQCLQQEPSVWGYGANDWTVPLLQEHLASQGMAQCSTRTLYRRMEELDQSWKRPRHVLPPDPEKEKKTPVAEPAQASAAPQCCPV
jgi:transposase